MKLDALYQIFFEQEELLEEIENQEFFEKLTDEDLKFFSEKKHEFFKRGFLLGECFTKFEVLRKDEDD